MEKITNDIIAYGDSSDIIDSIEYSHDNKVYILEISGGPNEPYYIDGVFKTRESAIAMGDQEKKYLEETVGCIGVTYIIESYELQP